MHVFLVFLWPGPEVSALRTQRCHSNRGFRKIADISVQINTITEGYPTAAAAAAATNIQQPLLEHSSTPIKKLSQRKECQTFKSWPWGYKQKNERDNKRKL